MHQRSIHTSEFVSSFHCDKICDYIADSILDAFLAQDPEARVSIEVMYNGKDKMCIMGEITSTACINLSREAITALKSLGIPLFNEIEITSCISPQSQDIAIGVNEKQGLLRECGAGDSAVVYGGACTDTEVLMPAPIYYARKIIERLEHERKNGILTFLVGDGKAQITFQYENNKPVSVATVILAAQTYADDFLHYTDYRDLIIKNVIEPALPSELINQNTRWYVNLTGRWVQSGDTGCVGHKTACDTYGNFFRNGDALSGKDPSKVDLGAYYCRYVAKNYVAIGIVKKLEVAAAYVIGKASPVSFSINTYGTSKFSDEVLIKAAKKVFDFKPASMIAELDLLRPIYRHVTNHHCGISADDTELCKRYTWERVDKAEELLDVVKTYSKSGKK